MRRVQIGMWNGLRPEDWERYGSPAIGGLELSQYPDEDELHRAAAFCTEKGLVFGIHAPAVNREGIKLLPALTALEPQERKAARRLVERDTELAAACGAEYVLLHYPFPPILSSRFRPEEMRRMPHFSSYRSEEWTDDSFEEASIEAFDHLAELQQRTGQRIVVEYDFFGEFGTVYASLFKRYPEIGLVIDTQRMSVHTRVFPDFDPYAWMDAIAPSVYLVHYSNIQVVPDGTYRRHLPVLPHQADDPAYGDAERYLAYLAARNDRFHVTLEHNPELAGREELEELYRAVGGLLEPARTR
ncbi:hypothetical protein J31TS4_28430 [Paenibacillus sp. J31TS4]|uniref:sugar phosphate isomerase/epimerase family protein n=1 Tax=Paenibacillus sp. J31TS4 TaxID=2807195 RepID=UPI001B092D27|nr:TIM barrel protein [Paenibacillus sp. J31TS4]GIP39563.1 hypothetical protein J31TS4_28430 [Paenibacillus sp. J31TS4]